MDFLNLGSGEILFLIVLAILLVGPRRAVEWVQQANRFAARLQQEWRAVQRDVMREVQALQQETKRAVQPALQDAADGKEAISDLPTTLREIAREVREAEEKIRSSPTPSDSPQRAPDVSPPLDILEPTDDFAG